MFVVQRRPYPRSILSRLLDDGGERKSTKPEPKTAEKPVKKTAKKAAKKSPAKKGGRK